MLRHGRQYQDISSHLRQDIKNFHFSDLLESSEINIQPIGTNLRGEINFALMCNSVNQLR